MSADFNWWLLLVGMVVGGALAWLVLADSGRRDRDVEDVETAAEASWIARTVGHQLEPDAVERVLRAHRRYLGFPPPDALVDPDELGGPRETRAAVEPSGPAPDATDDPASALTDDPAGSTATDDTAPA